MVIRWLSLWSPCRVSWKMQFQGMRKFLPRMNCIMEEECIASKCHFCSILDLCSPRVWATFASLTGCLNKQLQRWKDLSCLLISESYVLHHMDSWPWTEYSGENATQCLRATHLISSQEAEKERVPVLAGQRLDLPKDIAFPLPCDVLPLRASLPIFNCQYCYHIIHFQ